MDLLYKMYFSAVDFPDFKDNLMDEKNVEARSRILGFCFKVSSNTNGKINRMIFDV